MRTVLRRHAGRGVRGRERIDDVRIRSRVEPCVPMRHAAVREMHPRERARDSHDASTRRMQLLAPPDGRAVQFLVREQVLLGLSLSWTALTNAGRRPAHTHAGLRVRYRFVFDWTRSVAD